MSHIPDDIPMEIPLDSPGVDEAPADSPDQVGITHTEDDLRPDDGIAPRVIQSGPTLDEIAESQGGGVPTIPLDDAEAWADPEKNFPPGP